MFEFQIVRKIQTTVVTVNEALHIQNELLWAETSSLH
jgi:hypothetical protein